jgi:hypothetical protein
MRTLWLILVTILIIIIESRNDETTTISAQVFCDNYCKIYYNGNLVFEDNDAGRTVNEFTFSSSKKGIRTFAIWAADNPWTNYGIWRFTNQAFLQGTGYTHLLCLGDGGFRAIFKDNKCKNEIVVTNENWKCDYVTKGPLDITECVDNWNTLVTNPTYGGTNNNLILYDPCVAEAEITNICEVEYKLNYDQNWINSYYNDSLWPNALSFNEGDALKGGRPAQATLDQCESNWYCNYNASTWSNSKFIWSEDLELDNIVLCRFEYEVNECDEDSSDSNDSSDDNNKKNKKNKRNKNKDKN